MIAEENENQHKDKGTCYKTFSSCLLYREAIFFNVLNSDTQLKMELKKDCLMAHSPLEHLVAVASKGVALSTLVQWVDHR